MNDFDDFVSDYIGKGAITGIIIMAFSIIIGAIIFNDIVNDNERDQRLLYTLQGRNITIADDADSAEIIKQHTKASEIIKKAYRSDSTFYECLEILHEFDDLGQYYPINFISKNSNMLVRLADINAYHTIDGLFSIDSSKQFIRALLRRTEEIKIIAENEFRDSNIDVHISKWSSFWRNFAIASWIVISFCMVCSFLKSRWLDDDGSLRDWPWEQFWVYPSIFIMSPGFAIALTLIYLVNGVGKVITFPYFLYSLIFKRRSRTEYVMETIHDSESGITQKKITKEEKARNIIASIKNNENSAREEFADYFTSRIHQRLDNSKEMVTQNERQLKLLGNSISLVQGTLAKSRKSVIDLEKVIGKLTDEQKNKYQQEFDRVLKLPEVQTARIDGRWLEIYTDVIYIKRFQVKFKIGIFKIRMRLDGTDIWVYNLCTTNPSGADHPYGSGGGFCWGGLQYAITTAMQNKEFAVATVHVLQALQSARGDNQNAVAKWQKV
jgi:hypothetical protein